MALYFSVFCLLMPVSRFAVNVTNVLLLFLMAVVGAAVLANQCALPGPDTAMSLNAPLML